MIDAHAHLLHELLNSQQIIADMQKDNLEYIINVGTNIADCRQGILLAQNNSNIYTTVGLHPEYVKDVTKDHIMQIDNLALNKKVVAIGEIGLDYHYGADEEEKQKQKWLFLEQLKIANKHKLPVVIHCRDAVEDLLQILNNNKNLLNNKFCMHCYSEGAQYVRDFINLGAYFSFTGNITYKKTNRDFLNVLPQDKIMIETDCPYLSPEPVRGKINVPKNVVYTAQKIADQLQMSITDFLKITTNNAKRFFNIH